MRRLRLLVRRIRGVPQPDFQGGVHTYGKVTESGRRVRRYR